jgi:transcriptional regulator with XRE-family HTH domain
MSRGHTSHDDRDDLDLFLDEQLQDEQFKASYEDAAVRSRLLRHLTSRRGVRNISQQRVARLMRTTQSAVSDLENGSTDPRFSTLQRYARAIGCRLEVCVKDYSAAWNTDRFHEDATVNPVNILTGDSGSEWRVPVNRTSFQVTGMSNAVGGKGVPIA